MLAKSNILTILFVAVTAVLVNIYLLSWQSTLSSGAWTTQSFLNIPPQFIHVAIAGAIIVTGALAILLGGDSPIILIIGTLSVFTCLTLAQPPLVKYLSLSAVLFSMGVYGLVVSRNAIRVLMSIELMLNAVMINLVAFARYLDPVMLRGQVFAVFVLTVAAAEAAVGLAIVLAIYRNLSTVDMEKFSLLKW